MPSTVIQGPAVRIAVEAMMARAHIPGLSLVVVDRDRELFAAGYGHAELASGAPATAATSYLWFSTTKIVTATAALRLADEGRLDLDAAAGEYVPELTRPGTPRPTVRQLLNHTSGLANPMPIRWARPAEAPTADPGELLRRLLGRRRIFRTAPGQVARYSNVGYLVLGEVVAAAAGVRYEEYVAEAVLHPLGMTRTGFHYQAGSERATGYVRAPRVADPLLRRLLPTGVAGDRHGSFLALNPFHVDGPAYGGLVGDVRDVGGFLRMHLRDGELDGHRVLSTTTARGMRSLDHDGKTFSHGLGWFRRPAGGGESWVEHFGAGAGFWNVMRVYPDRGIGVAVMANSTASYDFHGLFSQLVGAFGS